MLTPISDRYVDTGRDGFSAGDQLVSLDAVRQAGKPVGKHASTCALVRVIKSALWLNCYTTLRLANGQLAIHGLAKVPLPEGGNTFAFAVVGGTRAYSGARGQLQLVDHGDRQNAFISLL